MPSLWWEICVLQQGLQDNEDSEKLTTTKKWRCEVKSVLRTEADWEVVLMLGCVGCWILAAPGELMGNEHKTSTEQCRGE